MMDAVTVHSDIEAFSANPLPNPLTPGFAPDPPTPATYADLVCGRGIPHASGALGDAFYVQQRYVNLGYCH